MTALSRLSPPVAPGTVWLVASRRRQAVHAGSRHGGIGLSADETISLMHPVIVDHAKLQPQIKTPVCLDEPNKSPHDARKAIELKSGNIITVKNKGSVFTTYIKL